MLCSEFDPAREAVINPEDHYKPMPGFPEICIGIFSKTIVEEMVEKYQGEVIQQVSFCTGQVPIYRVEKDGMEAALYLPHVGAASAGGILENLIAWGGRYLVCCGSCGVLRHDIADGHLLLPTAAVRDEGLSYHYLPASDEVELDPACVEACRQAMEFLGLPYAEGKTWTTDGFFRETRGKMERRKEQGCLCVEMECAGLAAVAQFRGARFAQFFWAADNLDAPEWDSRSLSQMGASVSEKCFTAALETGIRMRRMEQER